MGVHCSGPSCWQADTSWSGSLFTRRPRRTSFSLASRPEGECLRLNVQDRHKLAQASQWKVSTRVRHCTHVQNSTVADFHQIGSQSPAPPGPASMAMVAWSAMQATGQDRDRSCVSPWLVWGWGGETLFHDAMLSDSSHLCRCAEAINACRASPSSYSWSAEYARLSTTVMPLETKLWRGSEESMFKGQHHST